MSLVATKLMIKRDMNWYLLLFSNICIINWFALSFAIYGILINLLINSFNSDVGSFGPLYMVPWGLIQMTLLMPWLFI